MKIPCTLIEELNLFHDRAHHYESTGAAFDAVNAIYRAYAYGRDNPHPLGMDPEQVKPYIPLNDVIVIVSKLSRGEVSAEEVLGELLRMSAQDNVKPELGKKYRIVYWHGYNYELTQALRAVGCAAESDDNLYYSGSLAKFALEFPYKFKMHEEISCIAVTQYADFDKQYHE